MHHFVIQLFHYSTSVINCCNKHKLVRHSIFCSAWIKIKFIFLVSFLLFTILLRSQDIISDSLPQNEVEIYENQAKQLVNFLEYTFNSIGSNEFSQKEKDIIFNQSYLKIFKNDKVQVEDDLDENRIIITNKDVQAYLKDIDFFFKNVKFKFTIEDISHNVNEENQLFFKIKLNRNLSGVTIDNDSVDNNKIRYIEINLDEENQDLKIASIYTTKLNEKEDLRNWWNNLPFVWKEILGAEKILYDSILIFDIISFTDSYLVKEKDTLLIIRIDTFLVFDIDTLFIKNADTMPVRMPDTLKIDPEEIYNELKKIINIIEIDVSDNINIRNLKPLSKLTNLQTVNCSNTLIDELLPLRNLTKLEILECSGTAVESLAPLRYSTDLKDIFCDNTRIEDLSPLSGFTKLERLYCDNTPIDSLEPIANLIYLKDLRCQNTLISNLDALEKLVNLEILNFSRTQVKSLQPLRNLSKLHIIFFDNTPVGVLDPLLNLPDLKKIYCDNTLIDTDIANRFMKANPQCLVIYESEELENWWAAIHFAWQNIFSGYISASIPPTKEQLHEIIKLNNININGNKEINTLEPLKKLLYLNEFQCSNTGISNLEPLRDLINLQVFDCKETKISSLEPIEDLKNLETLDVSNTLINSFLPLSNLAMLEYLNCDNTQVESLEPLVNLNRLKIVYCDSTNISMDEVEQFRIKRPECLVIYQTDELLTWWKNLPEVWKNVFRSYINLETPPTKEQFQQIANLKKININGNNKITNLIPLEKLPYLKEVSFSGTQINDLKPLKNLTNLELIECANNPISDIEPLTYLPNLEYLDVSNTQLRDFEQMQHIIGLETLICPGTQIKNLKYLEYLTNLKQLECFNTSVKNLQPVEDLDLNKLKCYNTKISQKKIEKYKAKHLDCEVVFY